AAAAAAAAAAVDDPTAGGVVVKRTSVNLSGNVRARQLWFRARGTIANGKGHLGAVDTVSGIEEIASALRAAGNDADVGGGSGGGGGGGNGHGHGCGIHHGGGGGGGGGIDGEHEDGDSGRHVPGRLSHRASQNSMGSAAADTLAESPHPRGSNFMGDSGHDGTGTHGCHRSVSELTAFRPGAPRTPLAMWSDVRCPECAYQMLDEEVLAKMSHVYLEEADLCVQCPKCDESFYPTLEFRVLVGVEDIEGHTAAATAAAAA
ncbi:unnamed protein product, partial [Phaeothamnion confervicola]